jgi:hypothetical protein
MPHPRTLIPALLLAVAVLLAGGARAQHVRRMHLPAPRVELQGDSLVVPMESWQGRPVVQVSIDGKGPFGFVLDTGAQGTVVSRALADSLRLPVVGEARVGSPMGGTPVPAKIVQIGRLTVGGRLHSKISCMAIDLPFKDPAAPVGVLSPAQYEGLLVSMDFVSQRVSFRRGSLPAPDGGEVFEYQGLDLPTVMADVAGRPLAMHLDTGSGGGFSIPAALRDSLPLAGPPVAGRTAKTVDREWQVQSVRLAGTVTVGRHRFANPDLELNPFLPVGNMGSAVLQGCEVTLDPGASRIRLRWVRP